MTNKGQSLVEMTIALPILIFLLIGIFEIGYALRTYYIILNASRETARYAARVGYLEQGFDQTVSHTIGSLDQTMRASWDKQGKEQIIVLKATVDTLDCTGTSVYTMTRQIFTWPVDAIITTRLDITETHQEVAEFHRDFNCQMMAKSKSYTPNQEIEAVIAIVCWEHHQLFGFPVISNPLIDPVVLCADTVMRRFGQGRK